MSDQEAKMEVGPPREMCDHICLKDAGHVERGEPHFYGYELPSPRAAEAELASVREERDALIEGRVQMWVALANIRDECGPDSRFRRQAVAAIGESADPTDGTAESVGVEWRRKLAIQRNDARARVEQLEGALRAEIERCETDDLYRPMKFEWRRRAWRDGVLTSREVTATNLRALLAPITSEPADRTGDTT